MKTKIKFLKATKITEAHVENMWDVYKNYYDYTHAYFLERLKKNTHIAMFYSQGKLVGFSGMRVARIKADGRRKLLINFGQAVMEKQYRGKSILRMMSVRIGIWFFWDLLFSEGYCWIDAISFKSYLFFAKSMAEYYPTHKTDTPLKAESVIYSIGEKYYSDSFCPWTGTVKKCENFVTDIAARITDRHLSSPDIRYYTEANPGYKNGDGLITIVPMTLGNLVHLINHFIKKERAAIQRKIKKLQPVPVRRAMAKVAAIF